jgi:hypothetical protein
MACVRKILPYRRLDETPPMAATPKTALSFIDRASQLESRNQVDAALDEVFEGFDLLFREGRMDEANELLKLVSIEDVSTDLLGGILTATLPAGDQLPHRAQFFTLVEKELADRGELEEGLLSGLE